VAVDLGVNRLATCSNGKVFENIKPYRKAKKRLARLQRQVSRKKKGSANRKKAIRRLAKLHQRVAHIRHDALHKITTYLAQKYRVVVMEDLNVSGMLQNHRLACAIADCGFYEFRRQLAYKAKRYGCQLVWVEWLTPRYAIGFIPPASCRCQHRQKMPLHQRVFRCQRCGFEIDRDLNAALNLLQWYFECYLKRS
jgi:putative transposase